jgi:hypothetical protein
MAQGRSPLQRCSGLFCVAPKVEGRIMLGVLLVVLVFQLAGLPIDNALRIADAKANRAKFAKRARAVGSIVIPPA